MPLCSDPLLVFEYSFPVQNHLKWIDDEDGNAC